MLVKQYTGNFTFAWGLRQCLCTGKKTRRVLFLIRRRKSWIEKKSYFFCRSIFKLQRVVFCDFRYRDYFPSAKPLSLFIYIHVLYTLFVYTCVETSFTLILVLFSLEKFENVRYGSFFSTCLFLYSYNIVYKQFILQKVCNNVCPKKYR